MGLNRNLIRSLALTTVTVLFALASVLGAESRRTVRR